MGTGTGHIASVMSHCCLATLLRKKYLHKSDNRETYWCFILFPLRANVMPSTIDIGVVINGYHHLSGGRVGIHSKNKGGCRRHHPSHPKIQHFKWDYTWGQYFVHYFIIALQIFHQHYSPPPVHQGPCSQTNLPSVFVTLHFKNTASHEIQMIRLNLIQPPT